MRFTSLAVIALLAACSGGGGGSPPPPPPPPPPANTAPVVNITLSTTAPDERQSFTVDASGSSDANGDALTFSLSLNSSTSASITGSTAGPVWTIQTDEVSSNETLTLTVTVSDGTATSNANVTATISDFARTPTSTRWGSAVSQATVTDAPFYSLTADQPNRFAKELFLFTQNASGTVDVQAFDFDASGNLQAPSTQTLAQVTDPSDLAVLANDLDLNTTTELALLSKSSGNIQIYKPDAGGTFADAGQFSIADACSIVSAVVGNDRPPDPGITEYPGLLIGTSNSLVALLNAGNPREDFRLNPGFVPSAGELARAATFSTSLIVATTGDYCGLGTEDNFDANRSDFQVITSTLGNAITLGNSTSVTLPTSSNMQLVSRGNGTGQDGVKFVALLFSDGQHDGNHQLTVMRDDGAGNFTQTDIQLPNGVPTDMYVGSIDVRPDGQQPAGLQDFDADIVIAAPETPYVYVFVNQSSPSNPTNFAPLAFFEVGFGVDQIAMANANGSLGPELITGDGTELSVYVNTEQ